MSLKTFATLLCVVCLPAAAAPKKIDLSKLRRTSQCDASKPCPQPVSQQTRRGDKLTGSLAMREAEAGRELRVASRAILPVQPMSCAASGASLAVVRSTDAQTYHRAVLEGVTPGDVITWEWQRPGGAPYLSHKMVAGFGGSGCVWDGILVAGQEASLLPGDWKVRLSVNGAAVGEDSFTLAPPGGDLFVTKDSTRNADRSALGFRVPRQTLQLVWNGFTFFGFAVARAACAGDGRIPANALSIMKTGDMEGLIGALTALNASGVFRFDIARVRSVRDSLGTLSGLDTADQLISLFGELFTQVEGLRVSCCQNDDPPLFGPPIFESLLSAAFRLGIANALTISCQSCSDPLDPSLAGLIADLLEDVRFELTAFAPCIVGYDINASINIALANLGGTVLEAYVPLTGIAAYVPQSIGANNCFCDTASTGPSTTGTVRGVIRNSSNNQTLSGATASIVGTSLTATSAGDGSYSIASVPGGAQTLRVAATGFTSRDVAITITAGQTLTQDVALTPVASGNGTVSGRVLNAQNATPISGAALSIVGSTITGTAGSDGSFTLSNVPAGARTLRAAATGFISADAAITVIGGQTLTQNISLSPTLATGETRITLNWTKDASGRPEDLDLHLTGPRSDGSGCFHVYFGDPGSLTASPFAQLEVDNINITGSPATETVRISRLTPGIYRIFVHHYSGEFGSDARGIMSQSRATVAGFGGSAQTLASTTIPSGSEYYWLVATLNGATGAFTVANQLVASEPSGTPCR